MSHGQVELHDPGVTSLEPVGSFSDALPEIPAAPAPPAMP
jgi:hypothetical protein